MTANKCAPSNSAIKAVVFCIASISALAVLFAADVELPFQLALMVKEQLNPGGGIRYNGGNANNVLRRSPERYNLTAHHPGEGWYPALKMAECLDGQWIYFIGDSNSLKITESWRAELHRQKFQKDAYVASEAEYQRFQMGEIAWWQDSDVFYTYEEEEKEAALGIRPRNSSNKNSSTFSHRNFRFSFRFQQQKNFSDVKRKVSTHFQEPNRVFLKDGITEWFPDFHVNNATRYYGKHPDILWLSLGQWMSDERSGNLCKVIGDIFEMFVVHPATYKFWVNLPEVRTTTVQMAREYRACEQNLLFPPNVYYFDWFEYTSHFKNIFWGDGYHLLEQHQRAMMLSVLDVVCR